MFTPRTTGEITSDIKNYLTSKIAKITNFVPGSFNKVFLDAYSEQVREHEIKLKATQLSGYPDWAGKELTEDDLQELGLTNIEPEEINKYMKDEHLDQLAKNVGVTRDKGTKATGTVTVTTATDSVRIYEGTEFGTDPGPDGENVLFQVDADDDGVISEGSNEYVTPDDGKTTVDVTVIAKGVGDDYEVGPGYITFMSSPPAGVESVVNNTSTSGGSPRQSNPSLRKDLKNAVTSSSGGGTAAGLTGYVVENTNAESAITDEKFDQTPTVVDVIVDGGTDSTVKTAIDKARPTGVKHVLVRPEIHQVAVTVSVTGSDIDALRIKSEVEDYISALDIDDEFRRGRLTQTILEADPDISSIGALNTRVTSVSEETHTYSSGTSKYQLSARPLGRMSSEEHYYTSGSTTYELDVDQVDNTSVSVTATVDNVIQQLSQGGSNDYTIVDNDSDSDLDSVKFESGGTKPDDGTTFRVSYETDNYTVTELVDENGNSYTLGTDFTLIDDDSDGLDDSIDWSIGGSSPSDGDKFYVTYTANKTLSDDQSTANDQKLSPDTQETLVTER